MIPLSRGPVNPEPDAAASPLSLVFSEKLKFFRQADFLRFSLLILGNICRIL